MYILVHTHWWVSKKNKHVALAGNLKLNWSLPRWQSAVMNRPTLPTNHGSIRDGPKITSVQVYFGTKVILEAVWKMTFDVHQAENVTKKLKCKDSGCS